ncbi:tryptophan-rich sensory protein [Dyadobacter sp. CY345]|uniref:tryptophan-rich sensory protein n=1 Tax=Dyadobacter sp. CY345 TaxID=2909335 RepID=UPI001F2BD7E4|nr:tryptophan-rich sensory protein [Dyadobacter sp. CY345]
MASVSAQYQNYFTPAGYAFSIWGLIYILLIAFIIYQSRGVLNSRQAPAVVSKIGWMFVISCIANCLWILAWLYDYTGLSVIIMAVLLGSLISIVLRTRMELDLITFKKVAMEWWPFAIYFGWITVAIIANIAAYLTKIKWDGFGITAVTWTIIMISAAALIHLALIWTRNLREAASVGAWGLAAVAVANWDDTQAVAYTALSATIIILINTAIHGFINRKNSFIM